MIEYDVKGMLDTISSLENRVDELEQENHDLQVMVAFALVLLRGAC